MHCMYIFEGREIHFLSLLSNETMNTIQPNRIPCYSPLRQGGLDTAGSCDLGPVEAQRQINGLRAGVQTGHALAAQCVLAAS